MDAAPCRPGVFARSGPLRGPARRSAPGVRLDARHAAQAIHALPALTHAQNIHVLLSAIPVARTRLTATGASMLRWEFLFEAATATGDGRPGPEVAESSAWMRCGGESAMGEHGRLRGTAARPFERPARCAGPDREAG